MTVSAVDRIRDLVAVPDQPTVARSPVPVGQLLRELAGAAESGRQHPLTPLSSHTWFSAENYRRVGQWCASAVAASRLAEQSPATREAVTFLAAAMLDRYHHDRALSAASHLLGDPAPERRADIPAWIVTADGRGNYSRWEEPLSWSLDVPPAATDRLANIAARAMPDKFFKITYKRQSHISDPLIYAQYGDWVVKVAEW